MSDDPSRVLRADAHDNRERILRAARTLFRTEGLHVPVREIARHARVGPATLYRHFATKQALLAAAFADQLRACRDIVDEGCADQDPWRGFCRVIVRLCTLHAGDRGFTEAFLSNLAGEDLAAVAEGRAYALQRLASLAGRAKETGRLRSDFVVDDLVLMLMANRGIHHGAHGAPEDAARRFAGYVIQAFESRPGRTPLPPPAALLGAGRPTAGPIDASAGRRTSGSADQRAG